MFRIEIGSFSSFSGNFAIALVVFFVVHSFDFFFFFTAIFFVSIILASFTLTGENDSLLRNQTNMKLYENIKIIWNFVKANHGNLKYKI